MRQRRHPRIRGRGSQRGPAGVVSGGERGGSRALRILAGPGQPGGADRGARPERSKPPADGAHRRGARQPRPLAAGPVRRELVDGEALGTWGAKWMLDNEPDAVRADYVLTESGGFEMPLPSTTGTKLPVMVGEKGSDWCTLRITGTAGHGSMPLRTDNALVKAAEVVRRLNEFRPETRLPEIWKRFVDSADLPEDLRGLLLDPARIDEFYSGLPDVGLARYVHACTHTTLAPTVMRAGVKTNVIPDSVELQVDIRTLPGQTGADVDAMLREALGDLGDSVDISALSDDPSSESAIDTPLWDSIQKVTAGLVP